MPIFRVKSVKIYTGQKKFTRIYPWYPWQIRGMLWWYFSYKGLCICATICCYSPQTQHSKWWLWVGGHKVAFVEVFVVCVSVSSCVFVFLCVCVSICALICYHRPQTGGWEWDDGQTAGTRCRVSGNRHSSPPAAALIYALLSYPIWIYGRVAEVVRGHRGPPPKSLDPDGKF